MTCACSVCFRCLKGDKDGLLGELAHGILGIGMPTAKKDSWKELEAGDGERNRKGGDSKENWHSELAFHCISGTC